jgi:hypothetical protein
MTRIAPIALVALALTTGCANEVATEADCPDWHNHDGEISLDAGVSDESGREIGNPGPSLTPDRMDREPNATVHTARPLDREPTSPVHTEEGVNDPNGDDPNGPGPGVSTDPEPEEEPQEPTPLVPEEPEEPVEIIRTVTLVAGNPTCEDMGYDGASYKIDPVDAGLYAVSDNADIDLSTDGTYFDFDSDAGVLAVIAKGGNAAMVYESSEAMYSESGFHAPANASGNWAGLSHITFCLE